MGPFFSDAFRNSSKMELSGFEPRGRGASNEEGAVVREERAEGRLGGRGGRIVAKALDGLRYPLPLCEYM